MPFCYNNKDDFFEASQWSEAGWKAECEAKWGTTPEVKDKEFIENQTVDKKALN